MNNYSQTIRMLQIFLEKKKKTNLYNSINLSAHILENEKKKKINK